MKNIDCSKKNKKKLSIGAITLIVIAICGVAGTIAFTWAKAETKVNEFVPGKLTCEVDSGDIIESNHKIEHAVIRNTGNVDGIIRARIVVNWVDSAGIVSIDSPVYGEDYSFKIGEDWSKHGSDGNYYYNQVVAPDDITSDFIVELKQLKTKEGYTIDVDILAQIVQAYPENAVIDAWGVGYSQVIE